MSLSIFPVAIRIGFFAIAVVLMLDNPDVRAETTVLRNGLAVARVGETGRAAFNPDPLAFQLATGTWKPPREGEQLTGLDGSPRIWQALEADEDGWFNARRLGGGYVYCPVESDQSKIVLLEATGHQTVYVNNELHIGDPYNFNWARIPIQLHQGINPLLFNLSRGRFRAQLTDPDRPLFINPNDQTLPDLLIGEDTQTWGAVILVNASNEPQKNLYLRAALPDGSLAVTSVAVLPPLSFRKVKFRIEGPAPREPKSITLHLQFVRESQNSRQDLDSVELQLQVKKAADVHQRTFISEIDGSVQYYALNPAQPVTPNDPLPAVFLSLHGSGVQALGQANAYSSKTWGHLIAPMNRRPSGFGWEEWGRIDALESFRDALKRLSFDPLRIYLTGHSMGGHGTWNFGATFPDLFGAIGPCAGWATVWSYANATRYDANDPLGEILNRSAASSDTLQLTENYKHYGVFISHGAADDVVPPEEARTMAKHLASFHHDFVLHEEPGMSHWWDQSDNPGADCVDWPPMFDFFARHQRKKLDAIRQVEFVTVNPGVSSRCYWIEIASQFDCLKPSKINIRFDPWRWRFVGTTTNVRRLSLNLQIVKSGQPITVELDGSTIQDIVIPKTQTRLDLLHEAGTWTVAEPLPVNQKGPHRYGPFKEAFNHNVMFVYGTQGTPEENDWAFAKARYDHEYFWYRGNGSVDIIPDTEFNPARDTDRSVILYGNADTNSAWNALLGGGPIQVRDGLVQAGARPYNRNDLACLFVQPRPGSNTACVAAISGTGPVGMRLTDTLQYFFYGTGFPDVLILQPKVLREGLPGVLGAGFFGQDWSVRNGEFAWRG